MATYAGLYALLALGLNLIWGMGGMINLGLVGFFALGAYVSALAALKLGAPMILGLGLAALAAAAAGWAMALTTARLRGDYLAIITLGFSEVVRLIASNEIWLTRGTDGISGIPGPWRGRLAPEQFNLVYLAVVVVALAVTVAGLELLRRSPYGRVLRAIRDDEQVAEVAGKPVRAFKVEAFALSAAVLGLAGGLYAHYTSFIAPDAFVPLVTIYVVLALTIGGTGNNWGAVLGACLVVFFLESTRFATAWLPGLEPVQVAAVREFVIGVSLILVLRFRPAGILPERLAHIPLPLTSTSTPSPERP
jgi:branched-chain amino acid transport system permease protein